MHQISLNEITDYTKTGLRICPSRQMYKGETTI